MNTTQKKVTDVIFRKIKQGPAKGAIIALLPHSIKDSEGSIGYEASNSTKANYYEAMDNSIAALPEEFSVLENRLTESLGELNIVRKINPKKWSEALLTFNSKK
tara:strand:+ start:998 stop:1309 length:312 start_codon:yes stop_codon:yes gene_type:complete